MGQRLSFLAIFVLVTVTVELIDGVWVTHPRAALRVATILRQTLLANRLRDHPRVVPLCGFTRDSVVSSRNSKIS